MSGPPPNGAPSSNGPSSVCASQVAAQALPADQILAVDPAPAVDPVPAVDPAPAALPGVVELILAARDLQLLDGALAVLAQLSGWRVTDLDTAPDADAHQAPVRAGQGATRAGGGGVGRDITVPAARPDPT